MSQEEKKDRIINPLLENLQERIKPQEIIESMYAEFLDVCQNPQFPRWNAESRFDDYIRKAEVQGNKRLGELKVLRDQKGQSMLHVVKFIESLSGQDNFEAAPDVARKLGKEELEVLEYVIRKAQEAIRAYLGGLIKIDETKLADAYKNPIFVKDLNKGKIIT